MEMINYYKELYKLQDKVLKIVFANSNEFYLTGGTCISRFYQAYRYSDDLDFFANFSNTFNLEVKNLEYELSKQFALKIEVESKDFIRFMIEDKLQLDFINDRVKRCGKIIDKNGILIDNIDNILANKLTAIIGRDNPKDVFDLYLIDKFYMPDYKKVLVCANENMVFEMEYLIYRLNSFPQKMLEIVNLIDKGFLEDFNLEKIINQIKEIGLCIK